MPTAANMKWLLQSVSPNALVGGRHRSISGVIPLRLAKRRRRPLIPLPRAVNGHYRSISGLTAVNSPTKPSSPPLLKVKKLPQPIKDDPYGVEDASRERALAQLEVEEAEEPISLGTKAISTKSEREVEILVDQLKLKENVNEGLLFALQTQQNQLDKMASKGSQAIIHEQEDMLSAERVESADLRGEVSALKCQLASKNEKLARENDKVAQGLAFFKSVETDWRSTMAFKKVLQQKSGQDDSMLDLLEDFNEEILDLQAQLDSRIECISALQQVWPRICKIVAHMSDDTLEILRGLAQVLDEANGLRQQLDDASIEAAHWKTQAEFLGQFYNRTIHQHYDQMLYDLTTIKGDHAALQRDYDQLQQAYLNLDVGHAHLLQQFATISHEDDNRKEREIAILAENITIRTEKLHLAKEINQREQLANATEHNLRNFCNRVFVRMISLAMHLEKLGYDPIDQEHEHLSFLAREWLGMDEIVIRQSAIKDEENHKANTEGHDTDDERNGMRRHVSDGVRIGNTTTSGTEANHNQIGDDNSTLGTENLAGISDNGRYQDTDGKLPNSLRQEEVEGEVDASDTEDPCTPGKRQVKEAEAKLLQETGLLFDEYSQVFVKSPKNHDTKANLHSTPRSTDAAPGYSRIIDRGIPGDTHSGSPLSEQESEDTHTISVNGAAKFADLDALAASDVQNHKEAFQFGGKSQSTNATELRDTDSESEAARASHSKGSKSYSPPQQGNFDFATAFEPFGMAAPESSISSTPSPIQEARSHAGFTWSDHFQQEEIQQSKPAWQMKKAELAKEEKKNASKRNRDEKRRASATAAAGDLNLDITARGTSSGMSRKQQRAAGCEKLKELEKASHV